MKAFSLFTGAGACTVFAATPGATLDGSSIVSHSYAYHDGTYGMINEHGVAVGESTCSSVFFTCARGMKTGCEDGRKVGEALFSVDTLSELAMERTTTARAAVELMGSLASSQGFYGPGSFEGGGESLMVGNRSEVWAFQILP